MRRFAKRLITVPLLAAAAVLILAEEALWRLAKLYELLGLLPLFHRVELWIRGLPPYGAMALFATPALALAPVKLLAFYWLAGGHPVLGVSTILSTKVLGTAGVARLFQLTQPQLLTIGWFRWIYERVMRLRAAAYAVWAQTLVGRWIRRTRQKHRGLIQRRWVAIRARFARKRYA